MKNFWKKAIEKHRKGKGIKHKTSRGPKIKASAIFGGMGEREMQLRLELHLEPILTIKKSVIEPARNLCAFSMQDQERFINAVKNICDTDMELAYSFCHHGVESLKYLEGSQWDEWIKKIIVKYSDSGIDESIKLMNNIILYANEIAGTDTSIDFSEFYKTIESFLTGLNGRPLKVESSKEVYTDTETIYLPERISTQGSKQDNFNLVKATAIHLWAQTYYGTWRVNKKDFEKYENTENAIRSYHLLETIRLDEKIKKELPGAGRILEKLNPRNKLASISNNLKNAISILSKSNATYKESLNLIESIINDIENMPISKYSGTLKLNAVTTVSNERINQDKINFENALEELHEQWKKIENNKNEVQESENKNSDEKTFSVSNDN